MFNETVHNEQGSINHSILYHVSYHLSKLAIKILYLFFQDPQSMNKSVLVVGFIFMYALFIFQIK